MQRRSSQPLGFLQPSLGCSYERVHSFEQTTPVPRTLGLIGRSQSGCPSRRLRAVQRAPPIHSGLLRTCVSLRIQRLDTGIRQHAMHTTQLLGGPCIDAMMDRGLESVSIRCNRSPVLPLLSARLHHFCITNYIAIEQYCAIATTFS